MSFNSICTVLAITASVSVAENARLAQLLNSQAEVQDNLATGHHSYYDQSRGDAYGDAEGHGYYGHAYQPAHYNEAQYQQEYRGMDAQHLEPDVDTDAREGRHPGSKVHYNEAQYQQEYRGMDAQHLEPDVDTDAREGRHPGSKVHYNEAQYQQEYRGMDAQHLEPDVDTDAREGRHPGSKVHFNEVGMRHEPMPEDGECPAGYTRIGCCKCILSPHADQQHIASEGELKSHMPVIHGSPDTKEQDQKEKVLKAKKIAEEHESNSEVTGSFTVKRSKFHMSTSEEQAKTKRESAAKAKKKEDDKKKKEQESEKKKEQESEKKKEPEPEPVDLERAGECPKGFNYEVKHHHHSSGRLEACRMPMSYDLGSGVEHHCANCHYSYGRWLEPCSAHFVRNGCCTCTPHCPEGMVMDYWEQKNVLLNNYVCLLQIAH